MQKVNKKIASHCDGREIKRERLQERKVARRNRSGDEPPDSRNRKNIFDYNRAAENVRDQKSEHCERGQKRVSQNVVENYLSLIQAFRAKCFDLIFFLFGVNRIFQIARKKRAASQ